MMNDDELRAWYGEEHVLMAAERGAVGSLLISDKLFKCVADRPHQNADIRLRFTVRLQEQ